MAALRVKDSHHIFLDTERMFCYYISTNYRRILINIKPFGGRLVTRLYTKIGVPKMMARQRSKGLTERQKRILDVLEEFQENVGYPPSIREVCENALISSTSVVNYYLDQLKEMGYIERDNRVSRGIRLLKPLTQVAESARATVAGFAP